MLCSSGADGMFVAYTNTPAACAAVVSAISRLAHTAVGDLRCGSQFATIPNSIQVAGFAPLCALGLPALNAWLATTPNASTYRSMTPASVYHTSGWDIGIIISFVILGVGLVSLGYFGYSMATAAPAGRDRRTGDGADIGEQR